MFHIMAAWTEHGRLSSIAVKPKHKLANQPFRTLDQAIWWSEWLSTNRPEWAYVVINEQGNTVWDSISKRERLGVTDYPQTWQNRIANVIFFRRGLAKLIIVIHPIYKAFVRFIDRYI